MKPATIKQLPIIGVMGSGTAKHPELSDPVGRIIAESGCHLLTGGGSGVMAAVSRSFTRVRGRAGLCIGIIKGQTVPSPDGGLIHEPSPTNSWIEIPIITHLPLSGSDGRDFQSRNHINVLTADILIVLPGGPGTLSEVTLRMDYGGDLILFLGNGTVDGKTAGELAAPARYNGQVTVPASAGELRELITETLLRKELLPGEVDP